MVGKENTKKTLKAGNRLRISICFAILLALIIISLLLPHGAMRFGNKQLKYETVDSSAEREKGLSGRTGLGTDQAMLFVFDHADKYCFWMKDMKFSIDIVWLDSTKKIVHFERNVSPETYPNAFCPKQNARYVVEVNAGTVQNTGLKTGDKINF